MRNLFTLALAIFSSLTFLSTSASALPVNSKISAEALQDLLRDDRAYNYEGIVKLNNCSGALIRFENARDEDKGIVMSNGHCVPTGMMGGFIKPGEYYYKKEAKRTFQFLKPDGGLSPNMVASTQILYATMTGTDISLYELEMSYKDIKAKYNVNALILDSKHPSDKEAIEILSGYWQKGYSCTIDGFIYKIKEDAYTWDDSIRYAKEGCKTIHGTSGSPILSANTRKVVGINNTGNDSGERCTMDNPCEVSTTGEIRVEKGRSYGQETYQIYTCLNSQGKFDLSVNGCKLLHKRR